MIFTPLELAPRYTLPLINAIPPLSTNVIKDDNIPYSTISKLNSNWFTHSSGENDALSDSISNTSTIITLKSSYKKRQLATST
jgi:hypothetical protein